jgi:EAL domain-containing protein (putative c-di-GMP-specific phosphodiesterase class I)
LTADSTDEAKQRALAAGAKDFVTKPFERTEVLLRVKNLLETRALHLALHRHNAQLQAEIQQNADREQALAHEHQRRLRRLHHVLDTANITMVFQPIVDLTTSHVVGVEALARFPLAPHRSPDKWFVEAAELGLGPDLELLAVAAAVNQIDQLPPHAYLSVNVSPATAVHPALVGLVKSCRERIVLELTEHTRVDEYDRLLDALEELRRLGIRIAVDDAGAGYASLRHILRLRPHIIKLDIDLTRAIHTDPARRALATALVGFAAEIDATITAEGIETADELETLRQLHIQSGQGYHLARPGPLPVPALTAPNCCDKIE